METTTTTTEGTTTMTTTTTAPRYSDLDTFALARMAREERDARRAENARISNAAGLSRTLNPMTSASK